ncbi:MAG: hypothetical protein Q8M37_01470 [Nevskia sp.]|nr:hypothetical protein [Nevskia sp.]
MIRFLLVLMAALLLVPMLSVAAEAGSSASMTACRQITANSERLACYDRLAGPAPITPITPVEAVPVVPRAAVPSSPPIAAPAGTASESSGSFGAEAVRKPKSNEPTTLAAKVVGPVDGVRRDQIFLLDNGQRWRVLSDNEFDYAADWPVATIERNLIGTYWMRLGDRGPSFKVRRVQ